MDAALEARLCAARILQYVRKEIFNIVQKMLSAQRSEEDGTSSA